MLYLSLIASAGLLVFANVVYRRGGIAAAAGIMMSLGGIVLMAAGCFLPAVVVQVLLLIIVGGICAGAAARPATFGKASVAITAGIYLALAAFVIWPMKARIDALRQAYPVESMMMRVSPPKPGLDVPSTNGPAADRLNAFEESVQQLGHLDQQRYFGRASALRHLHEHTTQFFVESPGFGVARIPRLNLERISSAVGDPGPIRQPGERDTSAGGAEGFLVGSYDHGLKLHRQSLDDFLNPRRFGYLKDRSHSVGFLSHRFSEAPSAPTSYRLQTLDLVGLVKHDQPVAYVSEHLPRMDELKNAPTRQLDDFEAEALDALQKGDDLVARESGGRLRMLGAIRAVKQCTSCHGCERGVLLGAFSYALKRAE